MLKVKLFQNAYVRELEKEVNDWDWDMSRQGYEIVSIQVIQMGLSLVAAVIYKPQEEVK
jgi:hypothetical protein